MAEPLRDPSTSDAYVERIIGNLLRIGVLISAAIVLVGGLLYLARDSRQPAPDLQTFQKEPEQLRNPGRIVREAMALDSLGVIMLGLLALIATSVTRVLFSAVAFLFLRDFLYVVFTLLVLAVLIYSLLSGYLSENGVL